MRRKLSIALLLAVVVILIFSVTTAGAATRRIALLGAEVEGGSNAAVFYFRVYGDFSNFTGTVYFNGKATKLNCHLQQKNDKILVCRMDRGVPGIGGKVVSVEVNGFGFAPYVEVGDYCLTYYDWDPASVGPWVSFGDYCQEGPFETGTEYEINNPYWGPSSYYVGNGGFCGPNGSWNNYGEGLYFVACEL